MITQTNRNVGCLATWELAVKLLEEYDRHPINLQATKAYSPASIGKAYLRAMGIQPILERQPDFPKEYLGYAQSAFYGGRTSAHIRNTAVPVVYTDFLSMYPTVNRLMDLWRFVVAKQIRVVEERRKLSRRDDLSELEKERLDKALKVLANATSYGIYAEMIRQELDRKTKVTCYGIDPEPFTCRVAHPDVPGEFCFPPVASLITGAARLMLALLEYCVVHELGGTYAMEDTDSMAIVATETGGEITCQGQTFNALSWKQVDRLSKRFSALKPYDPEAVPESVLKIEADNRDPTLKPRQIYCLPISAKRYSLFLQDERGNPVLLRRGVNNKDDCWSEHGLGHLLNPTDPESEDREWIAHAWQNIVRKVLGLPTQPVEFGKAPAVSRTTVSGPAVRRPLAKLNENKPYADQIKPFNFLLTTHVKRLGHPLGVDPQHFHLIAPYESDPTRWLKLDWIDQYSGKTYRITTAGQHGSRNTARVKTYDDVLTEYEFHPEPKCADADGNTCGKQTVGQLQRRHIRVEQIKYIGKESNSLEEVQSGMIHAEQNVYTEYPDPRRDEWHTKLLPALRKFPPAFIAKQSGVPKRTVREELAGRRTPHRENQAKLAKFLQKLGAL